MPQHKRIVEVRLVVIVLVDLSDPDLTEVLAARGGHPVSVADAVSSEVVSNLESVSYVESAIASPL
jgi:hypothetical protein